MRLYAVGPDDLRTSILNCRTQLRNDICIKSAAFRDNIEWRTDVFDGLRENVFALSLANSRTAFADPDMERASSIAKTRIFRVT
jgi:hypothetical protein